MKTYNITVNGVTYTVEVEEVGATASAPVAAAPVAAPAAPVAAPAAAPKAAPAAPKASGAAGAVSVKAPMPGNIMKVNCKVGASVKKGDVLIVLEAMKMENDICAPQDGVVASVEVAQGASVETDALLVTLN
ncbi:MAG: biotin/lipoyl-binding protein [Clostridia bacterium]|nr:biotin/lipoyl-binding protein [Clostridia bacterium]MBR2346743.1 biotin/lipoyl-binding protein [Clostridia bacterium]